MKTPFWLIRHRLSCVLALVLGLEALSTLSARSQQLTYVINNGTITITGFSPYNWQAPVIIPSTIGGLPVTSIGDRAFSDISLSTGQNFYCLTSITIPDSVTSIGINAFYNSPCLTSVTMGNSITSIGEAAFNDCPGLTSIQIPDSVTSIGATAFSGCRSLNAISVGALNPAYSSVDAVLFDKTQTTLLQCPGGKAGNYAVPESVTNIVAWAFSGCTSLVDVTIPNNVTTIGDYAFSGCTSLTNITIGKSVTGIGDNTFSDCSRLSWITVDPLNPAYSSVDGVLCDKSQTTLILYPQGRAGNYAVPDRITTIDFYAFARCTNLTSVTIPGGVTTIGSFRYCTSLTNVAIGDGLNCIPTSCFLGCTSLTSVQFPRTITCIGDYAFAACTSLSSFSIPKGVVEIGIRAFYLCSSLTTVTISDTVTSLGAAAFLNCPRLLEIVVDPQNPAYSSIEGVLFNKSQTTLLLCSEGKSGGYIVPDGVASIGAEAFYGHSNLTSISFSSSVDSIGEGAFEACVSLTSVTLPPRLAAIGQATFYACTGLTNAFVPSSVTNIGVCAFYKCPELSGIYFQGNAPSVDPYALTYDVNATVYYLPGTTGWGPVFGLGDVCPTALWVQTPELLVPAPSQTAEAASSVDLRVNASSPLPLFYFWYFDTTNLLSAGTNSVLELSSVQLSHSGTYSVVVSNVLGAITSAPVTLNVILPVERRLVPGIKVTGETGSVVNIDYVSSLNPVPDWNTLGSVSLTSTSQYWFELTLPLPPQGFYRAWQTGAPDVIPSLDAHLVPAITLTGNIGDSLRLDYINQFGPTDAWVPLDTITLTNTSQLYFDTSAISQPPRLWRMVSVP